MDIVYDILALVGVASAAFGASLYSLPSGFIVAGCGLVGIALWGAHKWAS